MSVARGSAALNNMKKPLLLLSLLLISVMSATAQIDGDTAAVIGSDLGNYFGVLSDETFTGIFTGVAALCIVVTGFFLGRKWLRQAS